MQQLWKRLNFADRAYSTWFLVLSLALLVAPYQAGNAHRYLVLNAVVVGAILLTSWKSDGGPMWQIAHDWYPMLLFITGFEEIARLSLAFVPQWRDASLLRMEAATFSQPPTVWLGQFSHPVLAELLEFGYFSFYWMLPLVGIVLYGQFWKKPTGSQAPFRYWMDALAIGYITCFGLYLLFPTEGPAHTLVRSQAPISGPFRWLVLFIQGHFGVHGNAFPSGHVMAAVVSVSAALRWSPRLGRWLIAPLALMSLGAVYDGYHYASDVFAGALLGAAAFAIAVHLLGDRGVSVN